MAAHLFDVPQFDIVKFSEVREYLPAEVHSPAVGGPSYVVPWGTLFQHSHNISVPNGG
jgi:hypothetical protein